MTPSGHLLIMNDSGKFSEQGKGIRTPDLFHAMGVGTAVTELMRINLMPSRCVVVEAWRKKLGHDNFASTDARAPSVPDINAVLRRWVLQET